ncbi:hypothetical protein WN944_007789 [Citrus x changshan-huyou]
MPSLSTKVAANLHRESMRKGVLGELGVGTPNVLTACRFQFKLPTSKAHRAVSSHALFLSYGGKTGKGIVRNYCNVHLCSGGLSQHVMLWIYECVNILGHLYGQELDEDLVPRMLRWTTRTRPDDATNRLHLMSTRSNRLSSVPVTLEPSHKEKDCSYYKSLIEITGAAQPVQIVDGNYSKNGEGQNTVQATSAVIENEDSTVLRQGGLTQILSNMVAASTSQLKIDIMTGIKRLRNNIAEELEIHYKILMEELREQREILCQNEEAPTDINADNQGVQLEYDSSDARAQLFSVSSAAAIRLTRGLHKRSRLQPADGAVQIRHRLPVPVNITGPFTGVLPAVTTKVEELDLIEAEAKAEYQSLIDIQFEGLSVRNFYEEVLFVDSNWFQSVVQGDWLNNDHLSVYLRLVKQRLINSTVWQEKRCTCIDTEFWVSVSGIWTEIETSRKMIHKVQFDDYLINRFMMGERPWSSVDQASNLYSQFSYLPCHLVHIHHNAIIVMNVLCSYMCTNMVVISYAIVIKVAQYASCHINTITGKVYRHQDKFNASCLRELLPRLLIACPGFHRDCPMLRVSIDPYDVVRVTAGVPQQRPGSGDCGVFVLKIIEYLCSGFPFNFGPHDGPLLRHKIAVSMLKDQVV